MAQGSIRQRSKVRRDSWTVQVYLGRDEVTGRKRYLSESVRGTRRDAQRRLTEILSGINSGDGPQPGSSGAGAGAAMTVGEYLEIWLSDHVPSRVRPRTLETYDGCVHRYIIPAIGHIRLRGLRARDIERMETALLRSGGRQGRPLSTATISQAHLTLSSALTTAVRLGYVSRNVARLVERPRMVRFSAMFLDWDGVAMLLGEALRLGEAGSGMYHDIFALAIQTGLRRSELAGLRWADVDLDSSVLMVRQGLVKLASGGVVPGPTKSGRSRTVVLPPASVDLLRSRLASSPEGAVYVFCRPDGRCLDPDLISRRFRKVADRAGFAGLRFHDLRHTHASLMLGENVHLKVLSDRLGHSSVTMTGDIYAHVMPSVQRDAAHRFDEAWRSAVGPAGDSPVAEA